MPRTRRYFIRITDTRKHEHVGSSKTRSLRQITTVSELLVMFLILDYGSEMVDDIN